MASRTIQQYREALHESKLPQGASFPAIRKCLSPQYQHLPAEYIEQIIEQNFGEGVHPEDVEGLFGDIGNFVKKAATSVSKAMPAVGQVAAGILPVAGTVVGTAFGGPVGAALGGTLGSTLGGALGKAVGPAGKKAAPITKTLGKVAGVASSVIGAKPAAAGGGAAAQLLQTLLNPKVMQGLQSMALGQAGRQNIPVAGTKVPVSAIANLIGTLANQATEEYHALQMNMDESNFSYLLNSGGMPVVDPASPEQRAAVVLNLLQQETLNRLHLQEQLQQLRHTRTVESDDYPMEQHENLDHYYDMLELASLQDELDERELY